MSDDDYDKDDLHQDGIGELHGRIAALETDLVAARQQTFKAFLLDHYHWANATFTEADTESICKHIEDEIAEVRATDGKDPVEWGDIILIALHGLWRNGAVVTDVLPLLRGKLEKCKKRNWTKTERGYRHVKEEK
jgi:hypothetical protein